MGEIIVTYRTLLNTISMSLPRRSCFCVVSFVFRDQEDLCSRNAHDLASVLDWQANILDDGEWHVGTLVKKLMYEIKSGVGWTVFDSHLISSMTLVLSQELFVGEFSTQSLRSRHTAAWITRNWNYLYWQGGGDDFGEINMPLRVYHEGGDSRIR
ncbi:hypothetical protein BO71DRAFT_427471 [Aspergillus ellipticus CBS 707.79]|uniref:Uncharacterized protein n=1 Tax=Aspergillus ellipticus CBS 707.79 TaxID=1448320 RepID=A0A319DHU5_9EURO|nr:hypothetical protein BO71DRAFT_427471 [Aspergillus ellipticus CBS 707.79]